MLFFAEVFAIWNLVRIVPIVNALPLIYVSVIFGEIDLLMINKGFLW